MEAPQLEMVKQQFIEEEVIILTAGKNWGQPYSCEEWATTFGLTIPVLDDEIDSLSSIFGNTIPHNVVIDGNGQIIYSDKYHHQYGRVFDELLANIDGRRSTMIYTRPSIWEEYNEDGKNDFICTNAVTYYIRDGKIHCVVQMRSNDVVYGYKNDYAWQLHVLKELTKDYNDCYLSNAADADYRREMEVGDIIWQVQNLHVYERHFDLVK